jgi:CheY-like chemotaxis protein
MQSTSNLPSPPRRVLYIEDHPVNVLLMQAVFAKRPAYALEVALDGKSGLRAARRACRDDGPPDLLLLDLRLPDCHGAELLERLRGLPGYAQITAIAVTAELDFDVEGTSFSEVWIKPTDPQQMLERLDQLLAPEH